MSAKLYERSIISLAQGAANLIEAQKSLNPTSQIRRVLAVGCGHRMQTILAPTIYRSGAKLIGLIDPDPSAIEKLLLHMPYPERLFCASRYSGSVLTSLQPDAVIIASPSGLHYEQALRSLLHHVPTFVEKPLACTFAHARMLQSFGGDLLVASEQRSYRADFGVVRNIMNSNNLGAVTRIIYRDSVQKATNFASSWRNDPQLAGGGVLFDLGYHTINVILWLLSTSHDQYEVKKVVLNQRAHRVDDHAIAELTAGAVHISLDLRLVETPAAARELIDIWGTTGHLHLERHRVPGLAAEIHVYANDGKTTISPNLGTRYDTKSLTDFLSRRPALGAIDRHVTTVSILEQLYGVAATSAKFANTEILGEPQ